jgi:hypothetical protein
MPKNLEETSMGVNGRSLAIRDERGRLMPGSRLGAGNLGQHHRGELRRALITAKTPENIRQVGDKLVEEALGGNVYAAKVWLDHVLGRPLQALEISGPDRGPVPWQMFQLILTAVREAVPDPVAQHRIAEALERLTHPAPQLPASGGTARSTSRALG